VKIKCRSEDLSVIQYYVVIVVLDSVWTCALASDLNDSSWSDGSISGQLEPGIVGTRFKRLVPAQTGRTLLDEGVSF